MKVVMLQSQYGPDVSRNTGDELEIPDAEAKRMIESGLAAPMRSAKVETATPSKRGIEKASK